jgi:hypothetical protein
MPKPTNKEIIDYFRSNIFEAISAYNGWKMIAYSKSKGVVSSEMAERYVEIQKYHSDFFITTERAFLINFVILSLHSFDQRNDSYSLYQVDKKETKIFAQSNDKVIASLRILRNKLFAHRDINAIASQYKIPSIIDLDQFFKNLVEFYNKLSHQVDKSSTIFSNAEEIKRHIELLFMNLYRGEAVRKKEIDVKWLWEERNKKASDIL